ncbi:TonB-dependent receptor domain-containing protein [Alteromonas sp. a30]|uniref:TonB-dependent receptor domain-containing protein n=1 Tax=Alteromonas sp. a30 TaxID=2730917 RepID=UPI002280EE14|nr:TonB-dependent receptor [Alteromonas sp. a30]MCY7296042.1 TonB-dependent receptor [Alteromonas sp. a30]
MTTRVKRYPLAKITLAIIAGIGSQPVALQAQEEDQILEEVVAVGTRLKGSATAVLQERKEQAFVADILGAEQISRTGDSDAAAALRRVTGLTLVDGKFIYVRGLGERYSSTQLNGSSVPSPDPTRSVIPLDLFPSDIIESLSVQKSYSPSMPAAFGGGNVDIRLKTIPDDFVFNLSAKLGGNSDNFGDAIQYDGGSDFNGEDDGTRAAPQSIVDRWDSLQFLDNVSVEEARSILKDVNRNYDPELQSVDPDYGFGFSAGNRFDFNDDIRYGFLIAGGYDNTWTVSEEYLGEQPQRNGDEIVLVRFFDEVDNTEHSVKWSGMANFGIDYKRHHRIDFSTVALNDTNDRLKDKIGNTNNIQLIDNQRIREYEVVYEERQLFTNQVRGQHTFTDFNFAGFDWYYSLGRSSRRAPGNVTVRFLLDDENLDGIYDRVNESSLTNARTAARYQFQVLHDRVENYGWNLNYPVSIENWEMEFKVGADFVTKSRKAENRRFDVNTRGIANSSDLEGHRFGDIFSDSFLDNAELSTVPLLTDTTIPGDDYASGQKIDAYYFEADLFFNNKWRFSGGVRWEDYRQAVAPFDPRTNQFDVADGELESLVFVEDDFYPSLALTYTINPEMQLRFGYGETVVRPDIREVSAATYIDPLTDFPVGGTPGLRTTSIKNYDIRWEWYSDTGNNLSVALFYKDMIDPIESVQSPAQDGPPLVRIANAETGEVYGVEVEFLQDLTFISNDGIWDNLFVSGNLTLSDSEITLDRQNIVEQTGVSASITNLERRLTGHSEYVLNMNVGYDSDDGNHSASLVYNVFGERIIIPGIDFFDDSFEQPFHSLDLVYTYYPDFNSTLKFKVQNILDEDKELQFEGVTLRSETRGIGFSVSYKRQF